MTHPDRESAGFWDASLWEEAKRKGDAAIKRMADGALYNTSVTVVLIGAETASREYVQYEIEQSVSLNKGLLGIYLNNIKGIDGSYGIKGANPFDHYQVTLNNRVYRLSELRPTYDWVYDTGYNKIGEWVELAAQQAGR